MQAIVTKYLAPTDFRGTRVKATCSAGHVIIDWDYGISAEDNHELAANALMFRFGWIGNKLIGGTLPNGDYCWVMVPLVKEDTRCAICGVEAAKHGHWDVNDPKTHKWVMVKGD